MNNWGSLFWLAAALVLLLLIERWIHRHLQGVMLLLTSDPEIAVALYALPLLPGILLHELSHALAAILLGVRIGRISVRPKLTGQRVQLGFIPVERTDAVRASLIGLAPLLIGSLAILLIGYGVFGIGAMEAALTTRDWAAALAWLAGMLKARDAWLWAYAVFAVSNTMLPSRADRQAWAPVLLFLLLVGVIAVIAGLGPALVSGLAAPLGTALRWLAAMCTLTLLVDLLFALPVALVERLLERMKGMKVDY
jgi:hypothetical protein